MRLGDVIDDHCIKCRRVTNHSVVSILNGAAAKVRCRTCYHDHDYRHEQAPPSKKDLKKAELFKEVLAAAGGTEEALVPVPVEEETTAAFAAPEEEPTVEVEAPEVAAPEEPVQKKSRARSKKA